MNILRRLNLIAFAYLMSLLAMSSLMAQSLSPFIHVDQFGYLLDAEKVAVISNPQEGYNSGESYQVGASLELRLSQSDDIVYSGNPQAWNNGSVHSQSGDEGWWFDFTDFDVEGEYYVFDPSTGDRSALFEIHENPYRDVLEASLKTFYYNRCNAPKEMPFAAEGWTDVDNFPQDIAVRSANDQNNPDSERDLRGGWFDAGDYNKYVSFAHNPVHQLLTSYEENPELYTDDWNIPESGNGIPDVLDEVLWELDWLYKMVNADGTVILKMGSLEYDINDAAPPSNNSSPRYYTPTCSSASLAVASMYAHAAIVLRNFPVLDAYTDMLEQDALLCWNRFLEFYNNNNLEENCDDQTVKAGDADWDVQTQIDNAVVAAAYLFEMTDDNQFSEFITDNLELTEPFVNDFFAQYHTVLTEALLKYGTNTSSNSTTVEMIESTILRALNNNWGNYFGFREDDLYRAYAPDYIYYWGSNMGMANIGNLCNTVVKYGLAPALSDDLSRKAAEQLHYFHGVNPQGIVYLSNMYEFGAERSANEIFHSWFNEGTIWDNAISSTYGPAPGFLSGGPNQGYTGNLSPPANQPVQKAYLDYNDGFSDVAYEITEPAIYYQAAYIQLLANYTSRRLVSNAENQAIAKQEIEIYPNPCHSDFTISGIASYTKLSFINQQGAVLKELNVSGNEMYINKFEYPDGLYFIKLQDDNGGKPLLKKLLKVND